MKRVLMVDDRLQNHTTLRSLLSDDWELISAYTIQQAEQMFAEGSYDAIIMDACVPGDKPTTGPLTRKIRETYAGPMIAVSSEELYRQDLREAGCDREVENRYNLSDLLDELLSE